MTPPLQQPARSLGILIVHGMGSHTEEGFKQSASQMITELSAELREHNVNLDLIEWKCGYWGNILQRHQDNLFCKLAGARLDWMWLRNFVIDNLGDAVAYQRMPDQPMDFYHQIHQCLHDKLLELRAAVGPAAPLIIMAHSLGSYMISNYIWDRQSLKRQGKPDALGRTPFERMETLCSIITFGCNIAVLSLAVDPYIGIVFPPPELPHAIAAHARWLNFYDPDDVLGYPIKPLCDAYRSNTAIEDHSIHAGGIFSDWNPLSHNQYWIDRNLTKPAAAQIAAILQAMSTVEGQESREGTAKQTHDTAMPMNP